jgi:hypothetical protein
MLKRYNPYNILKEELKKRTYIIDKLTKKSDYMGGVMDVPFQAAKASSYRWGKLVAAADITSSKYVKGLVEGYKEIWGALKFYDHDLQRHKTLEASFVAKLLDEIPDFTQGLKEKVSLALLCGPSYLIATNVDDAADGKIIVNRPEYLEIGEYVEIGLTAANKTGYVATIDMNTNEILVVTAMTDVDAGTNPVDLSVATAVAVGDSLRMKDGFDTSLQFIDMPRQLLSAANGGDATLFGKSKVKYPFLQAYNKDGAAIADKDILETIFKAYNDTKRIGKLSNVTEVIMSEKNLARAMAELELVAADKNVGAGRQFTAGDTKVNAYGWTTITVKGVEGGLTLVGINEMRDDLIFGIDWAGVQLYSNGMFEMRKSPKTGDYFYEERTEDGYVYIVDIRFFGELVVSRPSYQFVIHNIS